MKNRSKIPQGGRRRARGFTLTELLVVIAIIAVIALLAFLAVGNARKKAWAAQTSSSLRQCATGIQGYVADKGRYPECYDFINGGGSGGGPWSWQIRDYIGYGNMAQWPVATVLHPRHGTKGMDRVQDSSRPDIHHFTASAIVLQDVDENNPKEYKKYIRPGNINDPTRAIMLGDSPLKQKNDPTAGCHAGWWSLRFGAVQGDPNEIISESILNKEIEFWINGKAQFLFVDGHVETLGPRDIKKRHFQL